MEKLILHEYAASGNCYKIRLTAAHLGLPLERIQYDILNGATRTPDFLSQINRNGRVPVLEVSGRMIPESNAACFYLAEGTRLVPENRFERADMLRWMFFEQYSHEPNIATLRFWLSFVGEENLTDIQRSLIPAKKRGGEEALDVMEEHLSSHDFFVGGRLSLADIALYAYTHVAGEAGFDLAEYPTILAWTSRVASDPRHIEITD